MRIERESARVRFVLMENARGFSPRVPSSVLQCERVAFSEWTGVSGERPLTGRGCTMPLHFHALGGSGRLSTTESAQESLALSVVPSTGGSTQAYRSMTPEQLKVDSSYVLHKSPLHLALLSELSPAGEEVLRHSPARAERDSSRAKKCTARNLQLQE